MAVKSLWSASLRKKPPNRRGISARKRPPSIAVRVLHKLSMSQLACHPYIIMKECSTPAPQHYSRNIVISTDILRSARIQLQGQPLPEQLMSSELQQ